MQKELSTEPVVYCANCGADQAKHELRTPLGFGCPETGCVQFFPDRTLRCCRKVCCN